MIEPMNVILQLSLVTNGRAQFILEITYIETLFFNQQMFLMRQLAFMKHLREKNFGNSLMKIAMKIVIMLLYLITQILVMAICLKLLTKMSSMYKILKSHWLKFFNIKAVQSA